MTMSLSEKEARKMLADGGQIDRREAEKLAQEHA